jgi:hypothetical protein
VSLEGGEILGANRGGNTVCEKLDSNDGLDWSPLCEAVL